MIQIFKILYIFLCRILDLRENEEEEVQKNLKEKNVMILDLQQMQLAWHRYWEWDGLDV
jgi:hypothetical protein